MQINNRSLYSADVSLPHQLSSWVTTQDSLTDKLHQCTGSTQLELKSQRWITPTWWDKLALNIHHELIFQREIIMKSMDVAYWYARAVIPEHCFNCDPVFFKRLEHESIKHLIFESAKVKRVMMVNYPVDHHCLEFFWAKKYLPYISKELWLRYSELRFDNQASFYLMELLLPELGTLTS